MALAALSLCIVTIVTGSFLLIALVASCLVFALVTLLATLSLCIVTIVTGSLLLIALVASCLILALVTLLAALSLSLVAVVTGSFLLVALVAGCLVFAFVFRLAALGFSLATIVASCHVLTVVTLTTFGFFHTFVVTTRCSVVSSRPTLLMLGLELLIFLLLLCSKHCSNLGVYLGLMSSHFLMASFHLLGLGLLFVVALLLHLSFHLLGLLGINSCDSLLLIGSEL